MLQVLRLLACDAVFIAILSCSLQTRRTLTATSRGMAGYQSSDENLSMVTSSWHPPRACKPVWSQRGSPCRTLYPRARRAKPLQCRENDYMIDREAQKTTSFTGIENGSIQDRGIQETIGRIYDRTREHSALRTPRSS